METIRTGRTILWWVALGFVLRLCARLYTGEADFWANGYRFYFAMAQNISAGNGIGFNGGPPTAFRVPLYPILIALLTWGRPLFLPVLFAQALIGAGTVWCAAWLAGEMFSSRAAVTAAALTAVYPYYVVHDTALQETGLFTLLTAVSVILLLRTQKGGSGGMAVCAGLALGADVMTRSTIAPFAVFAPVLLISLGAGTLKARLRVALLCAGALVLTVSPWLARSYRLTGVPTLSTETGFQVWNGNNPYTFSHYPAESMDLSVTAAFDAMSAGDKARLEKLRANEAVRDRWFLQKGVEYIRAHPWLSVANGFRKLGAAFGWLMSPRRSFWPSLVHALSYGPVMALGMWGMWTRRSHWREDAIIYAVFVAFAAVTWVCFAHTSHRSYLDVYWIVFAAGRTESLRRKYLPQLRFVFFPPELKNVSRETFASETPSNVTVFRKFAQILCAT
jgi:4-amino-4-deoxy-L-arabinose transferase-like glycosyltransferase